LCFKVLEKIKNFEGILMEFNNPVTKQIKLDTSGIEFSKFDIKKGLRFPDFLSEDLAYLCGILSGDGCISINYKKGVYVIILVGNPKSEIEFYDYIIIPLFRKLFGIQVNPRITDHKTVYVLPIHSKALVNFFIRNFDFPIGKKYNKLRMPQIIRSDQKYVISFIRGLADTDFCISLKKTNKEYRHYPVINCVSKSRVIIEQVSKELAKLGLIGYESLDYKWFDKRFDKELTINRIELVGHKRLLKWMDMIGFKSPKNLAKFELWKKRNSKYALQREHF
jgi:hypothetical protein